MFADIAVALVAFVLFFEWTLAAVIFFVVAAYGKSEQEMCTCVGR